MNEIVSISILLVDVNFIIECQFVVFQEMKENMALQSQAKKWIQVVKIDGVM